MAVAKPILFNTEMVQAIQDNRKSVTRRIIKPQPTTETPMYCYAAGRNKDIGKWVDKAGHQWAPPCRAGDIQYVRETWFYEYHMHDLTEGKPDLPSGRYLHRFVFKAQDPNYSVDLGAMASGWRPSIHMPKEAARIFLRVTEVRVERLQDMRLVDCLAEGVLLSSIEKMDFIKGPLIARERYAGVWDSTIPKKELARYGWGANPWVWVIEFERMEVQ
ncbi:MAG: hypothetical protein J1F63_00290 [Oscillospiraceae bacterium]|nr:hypothetical protein [Oscillospiraceae bacterium]